MAMIKGLGLALGLVALLPVAGLAQQAQSSNQVSTKTDWSVFVEDNPKECWGVSIPKKIRNTQNGREVAVNRGQTLLMVSFHPQAQSNGLVSFTGGYPFEKGSAVTIKIGDSRYELFTEGEWAWAPSPEDDAKIVAAMKRGADAVVTGMSGRGTQTEDTFSLLGFTAAIADAEKRCGS